MERDRWVRLSPPSMLMAVKWRASAVSVRMAGWGAVASIRHLQNEYIGRRVDLVLEDMIRNPRYSLLGRDGEDHAAMLSTAAAGVINELLRPWQLNAWLAACDLLSSRGFNAGMNAVTDVSRAYAHYHFGDRLTLAENNEKACRSLATIIEDAIPPSALCKGFPSLQGTVCDACLGHADRPNKGCPQCRGRGWWKPWPTARLWDGGKIRKIAQAIWEKSCFEEMPMLSDALEEAGFSVWSREVQHARNFVGHHRGCWLLRALREG